MLLLLITAVVAATVVATHFSRDAFALGSDGDSSDENKSSVRMASNRNKKLNINDGPQALSKMMSPQGSNYSRFITTYTISFFLFAVG